MNYFAVPAMLQDKTAGSGGVHPKTRSRSYSGVAANIQIKAILILLATDKRSADSLLKGRGYETNTLYRLFN